MAKEVPVYLFVGFLESGKTTFIQETFEDPNFDSGDKTLLLVCEEGEVEYKPEKFAFPGTSIRVLEDKSELNAQNLANLEKETGAGRVIIEYNGMWLLQDLADALPPHWLIYQVYARDNAMRSLMLDKIARSELIVFNRAEKVNTDEARQELHRLVRQASRRCDIAYEFADGSVAPGHRDRGRRLRHLVSGLPGGPPEVCGQDGPVSGAGLPDQPRRQEQLCPRPFRHDLLRAGHPVCGLPLRLRGLQGPRTAQLGDGDRPGQL